MPPCKAAQGVCPSYLIFKVLLGGARYADGGLSLRDKFLNITPLDFYRGTFTLNSVRSFKHRAECEEYVLRHTTDIIGRTQWDHDHVISVNPNLHYHFMNETLRDSFMKSLFGIWIDVKDIQYL